MGEIAIAAINERRGREAKNAIFLDLVGPLCLRDAAGTNLTPPARKSQGLLALIGVSPGLRRSRSWLQDKLWSDRPPVQGSASLRQCLTEIRTSLGQHVDCLMTDRGWVALDPARVHVIADADRPGAGEVEFLEGLDIRDAEFEHWIRDQRMQHAERHCREQLAVVATEADEAGVAMPTIGLATVRSKGEAEQDFAELMLNLVASGLLGNPAVAVADLRDTPDPGAPAKGVRAPDWLIKVASSAWGSRARLTVTLSEASANRLHWADTATFEVSDFYSEDAIAVSAFAARIARVVQSRVSRAGSEAGADRLNGGRFPRLVSHRIGDPETGAVRSALA